MEGDGQNNNSGMAIENQVSTGQLSSASPSSSTSSAAINMNHQTINGTHFDGLNNPTPPRRPSYEDDDTDPARPRKRPATLATVELLSAECMSAEANNLRGDTSMANGSSLAQEDTSSERTMANDETDRSVSTAQASDSHYDAESRIDSDGQNNLKSDDSHISPDSESSSPIIGDSGPEEESYKNNNYVISNDERDSDDIVHMLEEDPTINQAVEYQTFETVILPTLQPHTYSEIEGRAFFVPMYSKIGSDMSNTISALKELYPCITLLSDSDTDEKFAKIHNEGVHAWKYLPHVIGSALKRSPSLGLLFSTQPLRPQTLAASTLLFQTFRAFFKASLRMVQYDLNRINIVRPAFHLPFSSPFIEVASDICRLQPVGMPHNYTADSKAIIWDFWNDIINMALDEPYGLKPLKSYLDATLERLPKQPELMESVRQLFRFPSSILRMTGEMNAFNDTALRDKIESAKIRVSQHTYEICLLTHKRLKGFINDSFLDSKEDFNALVDCAAHLLNETISMNPALIEDNNEFQLAADFSLYPREFHPLIADACLRMTIYDLALRKCKKLEVRLHALTTICNELLEVWKKRNMKRDDPLLRCIALFIRTTGLVEYILGPHSHFQLIQKASNVVGFLIVMGDFDRYFLEVVWQPIMAGRDQREVHATIALLQDLCQNMTLNNHYNSCAVLCEAPVNAWDDALMSYFDRVLAEIKQHGQQNALSIELAPYNLLIRQLSLSFDILVSTPPATFTSYLASKFDWLYNQLGELLLYGPQIEDKKKLATKCVTAMEQGLGYKATDLYILNAVLESFPPDSAITDGGLGVSIGQEIVEMDLISLLVRQTILCIESQTTFESLYQDMHPIFKLLRLVMLHTPDLIQEEHASQLWLVLCGENSRDPRVRNCSFGFFSDFLSQPPSLEVVQTNTFMRALFKQYFPEMRPELFVPSALDFCKHAIVYFNQNLEINDNLELLQIDGINQVWRIVTTAPQDEIAHDAINYLVHFFADSEVPGYTGSNLLIKINCDLVNISIQELGEAASYLDEESPTDPNVGQDTLAQSALKFQRSLLVLQELLEVSPATAPVTQKAQSFEYPGLDEELGAILNIQFHGYAPKYTAAKCDIAVPASIPGKDFYAYLSAATGLQSFRILCAGRELFLAESELSLADIGLQNDTFIILQSRIPPINISGRTTNEAVRAEVQKHFAELCQLLILPDQYSEKIWRLVARFPPPVERYSEIKDDLVASSIESTTGHPFKLLYALAIVKATLFSVTAGSMDPSEVHTLTEWTSRTLVSFDVSRVRSVYSDTEVVHALLECLLLLISHISGATLPEEPCYDTNGLVIFLLSLLTEFQGSMTLEDGRVCIRAFRSLLAISIQDPKGLDLMIADGRFPLLLRSFLLDDPQEDMRKEINDSITIACNDACSAPLITQSPSSQPPTQRSNIALYIWESLYDLVPHTLKMASQSLMAFEATLKILTLISGYSQANVQPSLYFSDWCNLLLKHRCQESIDYLTQDNVVYGLSNLMIACITIADGYNSSWIPQENLGLVLQEHFLFPPLASKRLADPESMDLEEANEAIVLTSSSRRHLNSLSILVLQGTSELDSIVDFLRRILTEAAPGLPGIYSIDRSRWLRSDAGHVGLRNLSNTCYLNSLLTQLFMNIPFRDFILQTACETTPPNALNTLKIIFANLQNSWQKAFEPRDFVATIRDYDGDLIDVGVQMDVEEFYNLLCDRIESQIAPAETKKDFRAFFGGIFVQQVKSMECEHVSEREEQFSAIQCDIKGKKNLQESLKAYVEGETLNGDNKYSCTNCNRHVDAVKRTCLKQIPNQVIFHLKRFEFDLRTMNRSKINDAFEFPTRIDLHPYSIDAINRSPEDKPKTDDFELVGVLVHSGTAETGHYYSYIKDRGGRMVGGLPLWFEFNDAEVSTFDPLTIPSNCFGGPDTLPSKDGLLGHSYMKPYSAYMLFYERVTSQVQQPSSPVGIDSVLRQDIFNENEHALRRYCLFDPSHLEFMAKLLHRLQTLNGGCCSESHVLETKTLVLFLDTFEQVAIKIKDCEQTIDLLVALAQTVKACSLCCRSLLEWLRSRPDLLRSTLLRCFLPKVRQDFGSLIIFALQNMDNAGRHDSLRAQEQHSFIDWIISECGDYFEYIGFHMRAWDDYFGFLRSLAEMTPDNVVLLVNAGFLKRCLDVLLIEFVPRATKMKYGSLARFVDKGRKMLHSGLLDFIGTLLEKCDLQNPVGEVDDDDEDEECRQLVENHGIPITRRELQLLRYSLKKNGLYIIYKPLDITASVRAVNKILKKLVSNEPGLGILPEIDKALQATVAVDPAHLAEPALQAIIVFLENVRLAAEVRDMVRRIAQEVKTIGAHGGVEHLSFFKTAFVTRNPNFGASFIANQVTENAKIWSPPLLTYHDEAVRSATEDFLTRIIIGDIPEQSERIRNNQEDILRELGNSAVAWIDNKFVRSRNPMRDESRLTNILRILEQCCDAIDDTSEDQELKLKVDNIRDSVDRLVIVEEDEPSDLANSDTGSLTQEIDLLDNDYSSN